MWSLVCWWRQIQGSWLSHQRAKKAPRSWQSSFVWVETKDKNLWWQGFQKPTDEMTWRGPWWQLLGNIAHPSILQAGAGGTSAALSELTVLCPVLPGQIHLLYDEQGQGGSPSRCPDSSPKSSSSPCLQPSTWTYATQSTPRRVEKGAQGWCTGMTLKDGMGRELGGEFRMGNICTSKADSCRCMAKTTTIL